MRSLNLSWLISLSILGPLFGLVSGVWDGNAALALQPKAVTASPFPEVEHAPPATEEFKDLDVSATLKALPDRMYAVGETSGDLKKWDATVAGAAKHIAERMQDPSKRDELIRPIGEKITPLMFASMNGYLQVVDELLRYESVRKTLEQPGPFGLTAWQLSNLAPKLSLLVMNPTIRSEPFWLIPYIVTTPYYLHEAYAPYQRVRAAIAAAGANLELGPVKEFLAQSSVCPAEVKARVSSADDVLATLRELVLNDPRYGLPSLSPALKPKS